MCLCALNAFAQSVFSPDGKYIVCIDGMTYSVTFNGNTFTAVQSGSRYKITVTGISAHQLGDMMTVSGTVGGEAFSVSLCALSYVYAVLTSDNPTFDNATAKDAAAAIKGCLQT